MYCQHGFWIFSAEPSYFIRINNAYIVNSQSLGLDDIFLQSLRQFDNSIKRRAVSDLVKSADFIANIAAAAFEHDTADFEQQERQAISGVIRSARIQKC